MISMEINGKKFIGFKDCSIDIDIETACRTFDFTATSDGKLKIPCKRGDRVVIYIDQEPKITGYVEKISPKFSDSSHDISISGRSITCDVIDSTVSGNITIAPPMSIKTIFKKTLQELNLSSIDVLVSGGVRSFTEADFGLATSEYGYSESVGAPVGENAFTFLEKYCRKRQVFFTTNGQGNIELIRAGSEILPIVLMHRIGNPNNNIKTADADFDNSQRFWKYIVRSQNNASMDFDSEGFESQVGYAYDNEIRKSRILEVQAEVCSDGQTATERAIWEANIRRARSFGYSCTVTKHYINKEESKTWDINKLVHVVDEYNDIDSLLLIKSVKFRYSESEGDMTDLTLIYKDALTLKASQDERDTKLEKVGSEI